MATPLTRPSEQLDLSNPTYNGESGRNLIAHGSRIIGRLTSLLAVVYMERRARADPFAAQRPKRAQA